MNGSDTKDEWMERLVMLRKMGVPIHPEEQRKLELDRFWYGRAFVGDDGKRIDPKDVRPTV